MYDEPGENKALKEIITRLAKTESWPNNKLPCDYLCLDTETTGVNTSMDRIVQIGMCFVRDCKISNELFNADSYSITIKLPKEEFIGKEAAIQVHGIDYARSQAEGSDQVEAYKLLRDTLVFCFSQGFMVCGHNLYSFDIPFFQTEMARMGAPFTFAHNQVVDTAMLTKAMQLGMLPGPGEPAYRFWARVRELRAKGVYYSLDRYCIDRFGLIGKYGVSKESAHDAGYDCWLAHLLVLEMNKIVTS